MSSLLLGICCFHPTSSRAEDAPKPAAGSAATQTPQKVDVDALKQKYWAKGEEQQLEVVQNRLYTKSKKLTIELDGGTVGGDPFQNTTAIGGLVGFYFNEYLGVDALYWKLSSGHSAAYNAFVDAAGFGANSNPLDSLIGGEVTAGLMYGKVSLIGKATMHFDLIARAGAGRLAMKGTYPAQNQTAIVPWIGFGQQLYITHWLAFHLDWRMMWYNQNVVEQYRTSGPLGAVVTTTQVNSSMVTGGLSLLLF